MSYLSTQPFNAGVGALGTGQDAQLQLSLASRNIVLGQALARNLLQSIPGRSENAAVMCDTFLTSARKCGI